MLAAGSVDGQRRGERGIGSYLSAGGICQEGCLEGVYLPLDSHLSALRCHRHWRSGRLPVWVGGVLDSWPPNSKSRIADKTGQFGCSAGCFGLAPLEPWLSVGVECRGKGAIQSRQWTRLRRAPTGDWWFCPSIQGSSRKTALEALEGLPGPHDQPPPATERVTVQPSTGMPMAGKPHPDMGRMRRWLQRPAIPWRCHMSLRARALHIGASVACMRRDGLLRHQLYLAGIGTAT